MLSGIERPDLLELPRIRDRISFVYLEHCSISRDNGAITSTDESGTAYIPAASIGAVLLGPGTNITHRAMELLGDAGASVIWVGEHGVRYYAHGRPLTHSSTMIEVQAKAVSNIRSRMVVARKMYMLRFPGEDVSHQTMQQLRGREGSRIRAVYKRNSEETGVEWNGRNYNPENFSESDVINQALSMANACLYGVIHSVIIAIGCSPSLGFVHTGHERSFVYDIADLYKTEVTIPIAFRIAKENPNNLGTSVRRSVRDAIVSEHIMERAVRDIRYLFFDDDSDEDSHIDTLFLWDGGDGVVSGGVQYSEGE